ncbi:MAG: hypothetical protein AMXMBFR79_09030 [Chitinophagaceae bacterium]
MKIPTLDLNKKIKKIKVSLFVITFLLQFNFIFSQTNICHNKYDSISILKYAQQKKQLLLPNGCTLETITPYTSMKPIATFDKNKCSWTIVSKTYKQSNKSKCKSTNGCTIEIMKTVIIDAYTGTILTSQKKYKKHYNFE